MAAGQKSAVWASAEADRSDIVVVFAAQMENFTGPHLLRDIPSAQSYSENCVWVFPPDLQRQRRSKIWKAIIVLSRYA